MKRQSVMIYYYKLVLLSVLVVLVLALLSLSAFAFSRTSTTTSFSTTTSRKGSYGTMAATTTKTALPAAASNDNNDNGFFDFLSPLRYKLEKYVAGKSIPDVSNIPNRLFLKDYLLSDGSEGTATAFDHSLWDNVLKRHVSEEDAGGQQQKTFGSITNTNAVNYDGIRQDPDFTSYIQQLENADVSSLTQLEQLAFWMNAYNALCINKIIQYEKENPGTKIASINDLSNNPAAGGDGPVWDQVAGVIGGQPISLNEIEHVQLRGVWNEPMVHACIVCASASCPNLRQEAFVASNLQNQMISQTKLWLQNDTKGMKLIRLDDNNNSDNNSYYRLELSRIFLWFAEDFGNDGIDDVKQWLVEYIDDPTIADVLQSNTVKTTLRYFPYDWQINRMQ